MDHGGETSACCRSHVLGVATTYHTSLKRGRGWESEFLKIQHPLLSILEINITLRDLQLFINNYLLVGNGFIWSK